MAGGRDRGSRCWGIASVLHRMGLTTPFPGHAFVKHPGGTPVIPKILAQGDVHRLADWLDGHVLPVTVSPGEPRLAGTVLSRADGKIVLGMDPR